MLLRSPRSISPAPIWVSIRRSISDYLAHPVISTALGGALLLSMASIFFAVGAVTGPWFVCEVLGFHIALRGGSRGRRLAPWFAAGTFVLLIVGAVLAVVWLAVLTVGPDIATADSAAAPLPWPDALARTGVIFSAAIVAVGFVTPFAYAPLILIERHSQPVGAVLESAWLVHRGGFLRQWLIAILVGLVPFVPAVLGAALAARLIERAATPYGILIGAPFLIVTMPIGLGLLTGTYVHHRKALRTSRVPPRRLAALIALNALLPFVAVAFLLVGALRPSPPHLAGEAADSESLIERDVGSALETLYVPGSTLEIQTIHRRLTIRAGDGGELVPEPAWRADIQKVSVHRRGDRYAIRIEADEGQWEVVVDGAGVRVDDPISARLRARLPNWVFGLLVLSFFLSALLLTTALGPLGALGSPSPLANASADRGTRALRRAYLVLGLLSPLNLLSATVGLVLSLSSGGTFG